MKTYRQLQESLPTRTVVFAFGRFNPPTVGHELLVNLVKKIASQNRADHVIYASRTQDAKKNPLPVDKKVRYLKKMFPHTNFVAANDKERTFLEALASLSQKYTKLIMVAGSDRIPEYKRILDKYNGVFNDKGQGFAFQSIKVMSSGERDPDSDSVSGMSASKMRSVASQGDLETFRRGLPPSMRQIDARNLMNDVRKGMRLEPIVEEIVLGRTPLRESYRQGNIFSVGSTVCDQAGQSYTIVKRGSNYLVCEDASGQTHMKWLHEVR